ncbi:MAG: SGNH/GDSL hydrolase family protein [Lentisphaerae bacterium]|nr:SGNH/GDSL hydrolase family protein [Lentisphaerota bacterium]
MAMVGRVRAWCGGPFGRLAAWLLLVVALVMLGEVALIAAGGGAWNRGFHMSHAWPRAVLGLGAIFGWYVLRHGVHNSGRQWAAFAGKLILGGLSTVLALAVAEVGLRTFLKQMQARQSIDKLGEAAKHLSKERIHSSHPLAAIIRRSPDPLLIYELKPNLDMDFGHAMLHINSLGMRDSEEYTPAKGTNVIRIVGIGDSGMFGWSVQQDEDYLAVLETNLNARADGRDYDVLNLGTPGYNTQLEVESLRAKGLAFHPDIVVVGWCDNDFGLPFFIPQEGQWDRRDVSYLYLLLFDRKRYADLALNQMNDQRQYDKSKIPEHFRNGMDVSGVKRSFEDLKAMGREHGFQILVMGPMRPEAVAICQELGLAYFNTLERIPGDKYPAEYAVHFMHPRAGGHRALADYLEQELRAQGWLPE